MSQNQKCIWWFEMKKMNLNDYLGKATANNPKTEYKMEFDKNGYVIETDKMRKVWEEI